MGEGAGAEGRDLLGPLRVQQAPLAPRDRFVQSRMRAREHQRAHPGRMPGQKTERNAPAKRVAKHVRRVGYERFEAVDFVLEARTARAALRPQDVLRVE